MARDSAYLTIFEKAESSGQLAFDLVEYPIVLEMTSPVRCYIRYHVPCTWEGLQVQAKGSALKLSLNERLLYELSYDNECGSKKTNIQLTRLLNQGDNTLRIQGAVFNNALPQTSARIILMAAAEIKVNRVFTAEDLCEGFNREWLLRFATTG